MSLAPTTLPSRQVPTPRRWLGRWWKRQSLSHQDRLATLGPLISVLLFLAAIVTAFWYLRNEEFEREQESVKRDTEIAQQQIRLRLIENQEQLVRIARELATQSIKPEEFLAEATGFVRERSEVVSFAWIGAERAIKLRHFSGSHPTEAARGHEVLPRPVAPAPGRAGAGQAPAAPGPVVELGTEADWAFGAARDLRQPVYSRPFQSLGGQWVFQVHVPVMDRGAFSGNLVVDYAAEALLRHHVPNDVMLRHAISLLDSQETVLASTVSRTVKGQASSPPFVSDVVVSPVGNGLILRGKGWRTSSGLIGSTLFWMVLAMSGLTVWMLIGTWRHMNRRSQMQQALIQETNFRRAMENSMLTGMRAMDLDGRITYVNPAFCAMTGFAEHELVGRLPPYPHWPTNRLEENMRILQQELQGRSPAGGIEVRILRKDGSEFDSRMYVSPLIDARGQQTGWMTSVTNITEAKRVRDQLSASHERFTTVLEGLEAAVSVLSVQQRELLFANRSYRLWFGGDAQGHAWLAGGETVPAPDSAEPLDETVDSFGGLPAQALTRAGTEAREVHVESLQKWFDVRSRYLQWTDGRLAQMLIATDITARRQAEELAARQAERSQQTSRLMTMGEMASSVAHELNQPLTAITNYCNGMVSRVRGDAIAKDDLIAALEKTAKQAQRAGQVIHRIRAFVKRSGPQRQAADIPALVDDVLELASFELRRRRVTLKTHLARRLPTVQADPILIEQVLLNLIKNAAEAIDGAGLAATRRLIDLGVVPRDNAEEGRVIEFSVSDSGPGLPEEVLKRLYEAFFSTKVEGLGIGLSLCRSIVESHRGRMRAENLYNGPQVVGCRFTFTIPVEPDPAEPEGPASPERGTSPLSSIS